MIEFLGDYSFENSLSRLKQIISGPTLIVAPTIEIKEKLIGELKLNNVKVLREFEAALTFFEGTYPINTIRELICLRIVRSKEGGSHAKKLFPFRDPGSSEARTLLKLFDELFLFGQSASSISKELTKSLHLEADRWSYLSELEQLYLKELSKEGFDFEIKRQNINIILFGLLKVSPLLKRVISSNRTLALVFDQSDNSNYFNQYGEVIGSSAPALPRNEFVPTPREYVSCLDSVLKETEVGVVAFDELEKRTVTQQLKEAGHDVEQIDNVDLSLIVSLIKTALEAASSERLYDLYTLLRITAVQEFIESKLSDLPKSGILTVIDEYQAEKLQLKWTTASLPEGRNVSSVKKILLLLKDNFMLPLRRVKSLAEAAKVTSDWIELFYSRNVELVKQLQELQSVSPNDKLQTEDAFRLVTNFVISSSESEIKPGKIKQFSSLDVAYFSEVKSLVLLGPLNGRVPRTKSGSIFLSSGILKVLGLEQTDKDIQRYLLGALSSKIRSVLIPRLSLSGDPTEISPMFYPSAPADIAKELLRFYDSPEVRERNESSRTDVIRSLPLRDLSILRDKEGTVRLSVTALDFYAASPFRFYLERILGACSLSDDKRELEPNQFGDLAHLVLKTVVKLSASSTLEEIALLFENELERVTLDIYGTNLSAAVETQFHNLKERLTSYAKYEHKSLREGWKTIYSEVAAKPYTLELRKEPILLTARVDRIDFNEKLKSYRIWDYKTGDNTKNIFKRDQALASLQLPIYALFLQKGLFGEFQSNSTIEVGYVAIGSTVTEPKSFEITERHLEEAILLAAVAGEGLLNCRFEIGESEKISSSSDFSLYQDYQVVDFDEGDTTRE